MREAITLDVELRAFVRKEGKSRWVAVCPAIGVASQGSSAAAARASLKEAVELWFESCLERGVLDQAMREANFRTGPAEANRTIGDDDDVLGEPFAVNLAIPAYQAAAIADA